MSTVIHFECRSTTHLATRSRGGVGGMVMHHGTFGYCDGFASDSDHRWVPTGGVFLEQLIREGSDDRSDDAWYIAHDPYWPDMPRPTADPFLFAD